MKSLSALLLILCAADLFAQRDGRSDPPRRVMPVVAINIGAPLMLSASTGIAYSRRGFVDGRHGVTGQGVFAAIEPGIGGVKAGVGLIGAASMGGVSLQAVAVRTWRKSWQVRPNNTYIGAEGTIRFGPFRAGVGVCRRTAGTGGEWLFPVILGFGLP